MKLDKRELKRSKDRDVEVGESLARECQVGLSRGAGDDRSRGEKSSTRQKQVRLYREFEDTGRGRRRSDRVEGRRDSLACRGRPFLLGYAGLEKDDQSRTVVQT